jgi:uncharacterized membrane protein YdbT with pleckstrin-like domain
MDFSLSYVPICDEYTACATPMIHARHTNAIHAEVPRFVLWLHVVGAVASLLILWLLRLCRRG